MKPHTTPLCSICGRHHRVSTYAQNWSPYHKVCASCGTALKGLLEWGETRDAPPVEQLLSRFTELKRVQAEKKAKLKQTA